MIKKLKMKSENVFEFQEGTLYPILHKLEADGAISSYWDESTSKKRKYYSITENGRKQVLHHFPVIVMRLVVYLCHKQFSVEFEDFLVPFLPDRLYGIVVDMHNGIPCILLHLDHAL